MSGSINSIETKYKGYRFRSRLEARWAVFFDVLGIEWEYEAEGYQLGDGKKYLPDFYLDRLDCFVEVKPKNLWDVTSFMEPAIWGAMVEFANTISPIICFGGVPSAGWNGMLFSLGITDSGALGEYNQRCGFDWCINQGAAVISVSDEDTGLMYGLRTLYKPGYVEWKSLCLNRGINHNGGYGHSTGKVVETEIAATSARFEYGE